MKVALSLSGGGFRATLFHLGVIAYLRRVGILQQVAAVCGVSGGAIIGAHLVHNWERYTGSDDDFERATLEVIRLTQRDVRGRILRRLPWAIFLKPVKRLRMSRCSMFERELSRFFGPDAEYMRTAGTHNGRVRPDLFVLATDLGTGQPCSFSAQGFSRDGLNPKLMRSTALRTATAVATSASFPGFFPPYVVTAESLGIARDLWGVQKESYLTDGGVFDNLGVRKLQSLGLGSKIDIEIVSDAGATLEPKPGRFSGLVTTALRAVDILSNRVLALEYERVQPRDAGVATGVGPASLATARDVVATLDPGACPVLIPIRISDHANADDAPGSSIQTTLQKVRTDLDDFSDIEVRWLVRHGGSVARQAVEDRQRFMTDVNLPGGTQPPWDPMRAMYPRRTWEEPDNRTEDRAWKKLETSDGRRLGLLSFADWVSWVNLAALVVVAIVGLLLVNNVTTRASFLSQAYDESYNVTFEYTPNSAKEWAQQNHPELIDFVTGASDTLTGVPDDIARQAREYRNNAGRRGQGRAFMRVIPPPGFKFPVNLSEDKRRDAIAEMRRQPKSSWKGILYYRFPEIGQERVEAFTMPGLDLIARLIPEWQDPVTVLQFEGHAISAPGKPPELCLDFTQDGKSYSRFSMKFQFESRASGPPVVPRNGSLILPRPRPASTDAVVTKSDEPCRAADDGFVLGMMRLE